MKRDALTDRQREILDYILENIRTQGFPPSIPEIQKEFSFKSPTAASCHLNALEKKGYISRHPHKSRGIEVIKPRLNNRKKVENHSDISEIPIIGRVAAGTPILASENIEGKLSVDRYLVRQPKDVFALRVKGDSMINAGIFEGDLVIVQKQPQVNQGEIAVALIDDEVTVKRIYIEKDKVRLQPENDSLQPLIYDPKEHEISIIGKVKGVIRKMQ